ncbi:MAG: GNAT family N-acetyltransferase [Geminicoccaceae bacterium]|nr:GNAT family N-acetyltransferase [Geminicoccaceae bacterium]
MSGASARLRPAPIAERAFREAPVESDRRAVAELVAATGLFRPSEVAIARELVEACLERGPEASGYRFLLADDAAGLAGYVCFGPIDGTEGSFDLYWIAVRPDRRGRGLGRALLEAAEARIAALGGRRVYVETSTTERYAPTRAFYRACGYRLEAVLPDFYAPGDGKAFFVKDLGWPAEAVCGSGPC